MKSYPALPLVLTALLLLPNLPTAIGSAVAGSPPSRQPTTRQSTTKPATTKPAATAPTSQRRRLSWRLGVRPSRFRVSGFSRSGTCPNQAKMTAFVPPPRPEERVRRSDAPIDLTLSERPTFWVYVTAMPTDAEVQFTLQDAAGKRELYNTRFTVSGQTGLVGVQIPKTAPALKVGENYMWQMAMRCDRDSRDSDPIIGSWVQRITAEQLKPMGGFNPSPIVQQLARATEREKPSLYAELGIWQDAVTSLIQLRRNQPNDVELTEDWRDLLTAAQMRELIDTPILAVN